MQVHAGHNYNLIKMQFRPRSAKLAFLFLVNAVIIYYQNQCFYNVHVFSLAINCILLMLTNLKSLIRIVFVLNLVFNLYHTTSWTVVSIFRYAFIGKVTKELIVYSLLTGLYTWMKTKTGGRMLKFSLPTRGFVHFVKIICFEGYFAKKSSRLLRQL
jgi:hypothetical protein